MSQNPFSESEATLLIYNITNALSFIHKANVIHRDLKPSNIIVQPDYSIKICDFGLSRTQPYELEQNYPKSKQARKKIANMLSTSRQDRKAQQRHMSPHVVSRSYRPPEVILREKDYGTSVDIWSFGCIIYEML